MNNTKPVYGFCLRDQGDFFGCKNFTETTKVVPLALAEFTKIAQESIELFGFLQRKKLMEINKCWSNHSFAGKNLMEINTGPTIFDETCMLHYGLQITKLS